LAGVSGRRVRILNSRLRQRTTREIPRARQFHALCVEIPRFGGVAESKNRVFPLKSEETGVGTGIAIRQVELNWLTA
jgi:hypothetical protein